MHDGENAFDRKACNGATSLAGTIAYIPVELQTLLCALCALCGPFSCQNGKQKLSLKFPWPVNESKVLESQCLKDNKCSEAIEDAKGKISI